MNNLLTPVLSFHKKSSRFFLGDRVTKTYQVNNNFMVAIDKKYFQWLGYEIVQDTTDETRSAFKTIGLGLIFLPLALFGKSRKRIITFERR
jgi:hypothetical protein